MRLLMSIALLLLASCATRPYAGSEHSGENCSAKARRLVDEADRAADIAQDALDKAESEHSQQNIDAAAARALEASDKAVAAAQFECDA